jgi:hypothetical protein
LFSIFQGISLRPHSYSNEGSQCIFLYSQLLYHRYYTSQFQKLFEAITYAELNLRLMLNHICQQCYSKSVKIITTYAKEWLSMFIYLQLPVHLQVYTRISRGPSTKVSAEYFLWQCAFFFIKIKFLKHCRCINKQYIPPPHSSINITWSRVKSFIFLAVCMNQHDSIHWHRDQLVSWLQLSPTYYRDSSTS